MKTIKIQDISESAIIIALYVAITYIFAAFNTGAFVNGYFYLVIFLLLFELIPEVNRYFSIRCMEE